MHLNGSFEDFVAGDVARVSEEEAEFLHSVLFLCVMIFALGLGTSDSVALCNVLILLLMLTTTQAHKNAKFSKSDA